MNNQWSRVMVTGKRWWHWLVSNQSVSVRLIVPLIIGTTLGVGFVWSSLWWVGLLGVPLLLERIRQTDTVVSAAALGWGVMTVASAWSLVWFWSVLPISWLPISGVVAPVLLVGVYWVTAALWLGGSGIVVGLGWWYIAGWWPKSWWWTAPSVWIIGEVFGSGFFSVMTWQKGVEFAPHFSFGYLGYLVAQHEWLFQFAQIAGVYSLSVVGVVVGYGLYKLFSQAQTTLAVGLVVGVIIFQWIPFPDIVMVDKEPVSIAVVETAFTGAYRKEVAVNQMIKTAITAADQAGAEYVVLSEDMRYLTSRLESPLLPLELRGEWGTSSLIIIDSGRVATDSGAVLRGVVYDNVNAKRWVADKQHLVPQGEYLPALYAGVLRWIGYGSALQTIGKEVNYITGAKAEQQFVADTPGILFCFESVTPWGVRRILSQRETKPVFVAHPISHAWFHDGVVLRQQLDTMLRVQARWNQVPIISAGNLAPSAIYYPSGIINDVPREGIQVNDRVKVKLFTL